MLLKSMVMRRMRIIIAIAHTEDCEKSKTALRAITRSITGLSTFSGRVCIIGLTALYHIVLRVDIGGQT